MQIHSSTTSLVCITVSNSPNLLVFRRGQNVNTVKVLYCLIVAVFFCKFQCLIVDSESPSSIRCSEGRTESNDKGLACYYSTRLIGLFWIRRAGFKMF